MELKIKRTNLYLLLILVLALVLRVAAAVHVGVGPDEIVYTTRAINFMSAGKLSTLDQSPVYFVVQDIIYRILGFTALTARLTSVIFGALAIVVIYLLGRELYSKQAGLMAAFFFAVSAYVVRYNIEMDMFAIFFTFVGFYFSNHVGPPFNLLRPNFLTHFCFFFR